MTKRISAKVRAERDKLKAALEVAMETLEDIRTMKPDPLVQPLQRDLRHMVMAAQQASGEALAEINEVLKQ